MQPENKILGREDIKGFQRLWIYLDADGQNFKVCIDDDDYLITREVCLEPGDPRIISPTIVESEPLPAHELLARCRNRFSQISSS